MAGWGKETKAHPRHLVRVTLRRGNLSTGVTRNASAEPSAHPCGGIRPSQMIPQS